MLNCIIYPKWRNNKTQPFYIHHWCKSNRERTQTFVIGHWNLRCKVIDCILDQSVDNKNAILHVLNVTSCCAIMSSTFLVQYFSKLWRIASNLITLNCYCSLNFIFWSCILDVSRDTCKWSKWSTSMESEWIFLSTVMKLNFHSQN